MKPDGKILILGWPVVPFQQWLSDYPTIDVARIYKDPRNRLEKAHKDFTFHTPDILRHSFARLSPVYWYGDWKNNVSEYHTIIIIDEIRGKDIFEYILGKNPRCNLCVFYDSPIKNGSTRVPDRYKNLQVKFFTCDPGIAKAYDIKFHPYFYIFQPDEQVTETDNGSLSPPPGRCLLHR